MASFAKGFPGTKEAWIWKWVRMNFDYDPLEHWNRITKPVLVMYGEKDEQDNVPVYQSSYLPETAYIKNGNPDCRITIYRETGHALYEKEKAVVRADILRDFSGWILAR